MDARKLRLYKPPSWAEKLNHQPSHYLELAMRPTPIHKWELPGVPSGFEVFVKRDDMTGSTLTGNKVRKLEFHLAKAVQQGCDKIITSGSIKSNHARATALAARQVGLDTHLLLFTEELMNPDAVGTSENVLLDRLAGAQILLVSLATVSEIKTSVVIERLSSLMADYAAKLRSDGHVPYIVPLGGSGTTGAWGYFEAFREMMEQGVLEDFDDIVMPVGSGGTVCGVAIANYLTGSKLKVHGVCISGDPGYYYEQISHEMKDFGLTTDDQGQPICANNMIDIIDGYVGPGYGKYTNKDLAQLIDIAGQTSIILDPVFTLKGVQGMLGELNSNPGRFAGKRILFLHTGGAFVLFSGALDELVKKTPITNQIYSYSDIIPEKWNQGFC